MYNKIKVNLLDFKDLLKGFIPNGKVEIFLFIGFLLFYLSYSFFIAFNTSLIQGNGVFFFDLYFSFDNPLIFRQGYFSNYDVAHPFMRYINKPYMFIGELLTSYWGIKAKIIFSIFLCSSAISLSIVYIYRYLKIVVNNNVFICILLSVFYGLFTTNIILSFTLESYTLTVFLLTYCIYYYSYIIKQNKKPILLSNLFFSFGLGGITLTNYIKGLIPILFVKGEFKSAMKRIVGISILFVAVIALMEVLSNSFSFQQTITQKLSFVVDEETENSFFVKIIDLFFVAPIFFLGVIKEPVQLLINGKTESFSAINMDSISYWWQYLYAILVYGLITWSIILNRKNKLVWLILLVYLVDIVIHVIIGYGLKDPFIFGGHWVYVIPILLGWLYQSLNNTMKQKCYTLLLITMLIGLFINNALQMKDFISVAMDIFPSV